MALGFRDATDALLSCITHEELAKELGVSIASVRQARLEPSAKAHRSPPEGWQAAVARLAKARGSRLTALAKRLGAK